MDWVGIKNKALDAFKKYRYAILILVAGAILMLIPGRSAEPSQTNAEPSQAIEQKSITQELTQILSQINGVGKVQVMLTVASGERTIYQYDEDSKAGENGSVRKDTVIISDADRNESGLIQQVIPAKYQGAVIVCEGADHAAVCLAVVDAVSKVTGLGADRISVLKMK